MELELKHIAPFANSRLEGRLLNGPLDLLTTIDFENGIVSTLNSGSAEVRDFKPCVRLFRQLTEPITHNGDRFIPAERLVAECRGAQIEAYVAERSKDLTITATYTLMGDVFTDFLVNRSSVDSVDYKYVRQLIEWGFNVFNLPAELIVEKPNH